MRDQTLRDTVEATPARSRVLLPAAVACGGLWIGAAVIAGQGMYGSTLIVISAAGLVITTVLLGLIQRQHVRLRRLARTDALTGLVNHRSFFDLLAAELERARELGTSVAVATLDLDNFKLVNDSKGHPFGDRVLSQVGEALRATVRASDVAARVGGEEFALILPGSDATAAVSVAERARARIAEIPISGVELGSSAGVASFPSDAEDPTSLVQLADSALQWAKRGGKQRTRRFDPEHSPASWSDRQRAEIVALLELDRPVTPRFQPVVSLATGRVVGYEALARFAGASMRSPEVWFAQAHGCGLGSELEAVAIRAALEPLGRPLDTHLALNVSPSALGSDVVGEALRGDLQGIVIEITEHEFVPDDDALAAAVAHLRERGAQIAIDDAGAGHAGLKQLMRVRPDIVKLDQALIRQIHTDPARMALVESFVRFARDVGATVCAEGVESLEELAVLADLDVQWGQGYALGHPADPWAEVAPAAAELCRSALAETFRSLPAERHPLGSSDRRLVHVSARLANARTRRDLESVLALIAAELGAGAVCLSAWHPEDSLIETLAETGDRGEQTLFEIDEYPLSAQVLREQEAVQLLVGDPASDPREVELLLGFDQRALLMVPVVCRGESLGLVEAYRSDERTWTRAEINRARVIANQLASVIQTLTSSASPEWDARASAGRETRA